MREENNNYLGFGLFFFFIVLLILIGSITLYVSHKEKYGTGKTDEAKVLITEKIKQDKSKEYIYYTLEEKVSEQMDIVLKKAVINLKNKDALEINENLESIYDRALKSVKKSNTEENICANGSDIYSLNTLDYAEYKENGMITLLITENNYSCNEEIEKPSKIYAYTFDGLTGSLISFNQLLEKYGLTYTKVLEILKNYLNERQTENSNIKIEETLNELKENENYVIYVSETKKLVMKYIVKTSDGDYNDIIELN